MQAAKEKVSNIVTDAKEGMEKAKATTQEKIEKMSAHGHKEKEIAHQKKEARVAQAEMKAHQAKAEHATKTEDAHHGQHRLTTPLGGTGTGTTGSVLHPHPGNGGLMGHHGAAQDHGIGLGHGPAGDAGLGHHGHYEHGHGNAVGHGLGLGHEQSHGGQVPGHSHDQGHRHHGLGHGLGLGHPGGTDGATNENYGPTYDPITGHPINRPGNTM